jgi:hypothetical protein
VATHRHQKAGRIPQREGLIAEWGRTKSAVSPMGYTAMHSANARRSCYVRVLSMTDGLVPDRNL